MFRLVTLAKPDEIVGPRPIYPAYRADMLTMVLDNGEPEFVGLEQYQQMPPERRARCRAAHVEAGMTRYGVGVCFDGGDHIADPVPFLPILQELHAEGLGPQVWACPEDAPAMQAKYGDVNVFISTMRAAMDVWKPWVTEIWLGVEADEVWSASEMLKIAEGLRSYGLPIALHLGQGHVLPRDVSNPSWWGQAKNAGITMFGYQAKHAAVEDSGGAFLSDLNTIRNELRTAVQTVGGNVQVISSEYAYFGRDPSQETIAYVTEGGFRCGEKSLEEPGIAGIGNGGPGYWPPATSEGVAGVDEIDVNTVTFYSTHPYSDISAMIRSWPIDSKLTPAFFDNNRKINFAHTEADSWPVIPGDANNGNANTWMIVFYEGAWRGYTTDYLRRGDSETDKLWEEVNHWVHEPITYGPPASGETIYLMVSRMDPRLNKYHPAQAPYTRTNLVKVLAP